MNDMEVSENDSMIKIVELSKSFDMEAEKVSVLHNIEMEIFKGESISIVGKSGVGKSTLLHAIGAIDPPTSGKVLFEGKDLYTMSSRGLANFRNTHIGFVFQFHHLLGDFTALENISMPAVIRGENWQDARKNSEKYLSMVGLDHRATHRPGELSGGEQQRVSLARAISLEPSVLLADEPTGNLDSQTGKEVFDILMNLCTEKQISFVVVTHDENLSNKTDRCLRIVDGEIYSFETRVKHPVG